MARHSATKAIKRSERAGARRWRIELARKARKIKAWRRQ